MRRLIVSPLARGRLVPALRQNPGRMFQSSKSSKQGTPAADAGQAMPLGPYYDSILNNPPPYAREKPEEPPASSTKTEHQEPAPETASEKPKVSRGRKPKEDKPGATPPSSRKSQATAEASESSLMETSPPSPPPRSAEEQVRVVFGSRLLGPAERAEKLAEIRSRSTLVAGVLVPPRPEEPDNCCMSGCVNCVWDRYRDDMEDWASAHSDAESRLRAQEAGATGAISTAGTPAAARSAQSAGSTPISMDDDGGGSESNWDPLQKDSRKFAKDFWDEDLYKSLPVGIREFMKQEKRLKLKHEKEGTVGG